MKISDEFYLKEVGDLAKASEPSDYFMVMTLFSSFFFLELSLLNMSTEVEYTKKDAIQVNNQTLTKIFININRYENNPPSNIQNKWIENYDISDDQVLIKFPLNTKKYENTHIIILKYKLNNQYNRTRDYVNIKLLRQILISKNNSKDKVIKKPKLSYTHKNFNITDNFSKYTNYSRCSNFKDFNSNILEISISHNHISTNLNISYSFRNTLSNNITISIFNTILKGINRTIPKDTTNSNTFTTLYKAGFTPAFFMQKFKTNKAVRGYKLNLEV